MSTPERDQVVRQREPLHRRQIHPGQLSMVVVVKRSRQRRTRRLEMICPERSGRSGGGLRGGGGALPGSRPGGYLGEHGRIVTSGPLDCVNKTSIVVVAPKISRGWRRVDIVRRRSIENWIIRYPSCFSFVVTRIVDCSSLLEPGDNFCADELRSFFFFKLFLSKVRSWIFQKRRNIALKIESSNSLRPRS